MIKKERKHLLLSAEKKAEDYFDFIISTFHNVHPRTCFMHSIYIVLWTSSYVTAAL